MFLPLPEEKTVTKMRPRNAIDVINTSTTELILEN